LPCEAKYQLKKETHETSRKKKKENQMTYSILGGKKGDLGRNRDARQKKNRGAPEEGHLFLKKRRHASSLNPTEPK